MKRFYKLVSISEEKGGYTVLLDGKPVRTPSKQLLLAPTKEMANALMQEWNAQETSIVPNTMPLTQILTTKIDRISVERPTMTALLLKYLDTDLLCYRATHPPEMGKRQRESWDPWLEWFEKEFGGKLKITEDLVALKQDLELHKKIQSFVEALDDNRFTIFQLITSLSGSIVLGLAFVSKKATPDHVFSASRVEEAYHAELANEKLHGPDPAQDKKDHANMRDLQASAEFLAFLK